MISLKRLWQLTATPVGGFAPLTVTFSGTAAAAIGTVQQVLLDYTGDHVTLNSTTLSPPPHAYSAAGQFFPVLTVVTSVGRFSSPGGWNSIFEPLRVNVESPPVVLSTISINNPVDLKWMPGNYLYVLSAAGNSVTEYDVSATPPSVLRTKSLADAGFNPRGLDVDASGNLYVAMTSSHKVAKYNPVTGSFQLDPSFGTSGLIGSYGSGNGQFKSPWDVAAGPDGSEITISDCGNNRLQRFSSSGVFLEAFGTQGSGAGQYATPKGIFYDLTGYLYIADSGNSRIVLTTSGDYSGSSGSVGPSLGQFQSPSNGARGNRGLYVADTDNNRVQIFEVFHGGEGVSPTPFICRGALSTELGLNHPGAVAGCGDLTDEKLWIADTGNNRVLLARLPVDSLEPVWTATKQQLLAANVSGATSYFSASTAETYRQRFLSVTPADLVQMVSRLPGVVPVFIDSDTAEYRFEQTLGGRALSFPIDFARENGAWKIVAF